MIQILKQHAVEIKHINQKLIVKKTIKEEVINFFVNGF